MNDYLKALPDEDRCLLKAGAVPDWTAPMLATLTDERFSDPDWIYEQKLDGERALAFRKAGKVRLLTRNRKNISSTYPEIVEALCEQDARDFVVDGEIVAFRDGVTSFARLQPRLQIKDATEARSHDVAVYYYLFDLLHLGRHKVQCLPLRRRKALLKQAISFRGRLRYSAHRNRDGEVFFREACAKRWEGIIAKRAASRYSHGRSTNWLKFKCESGQELVIGGFTEPSNSRVGFGALLVGYYEEGSLRYAGKVGTGYDNDFLIRFRARLDGLARRTSPFHDKVDEPGVTWVTPKLVGEFRFTEWTKAGKLRHSRFLGLRRDKAPEDVTREAPGS